jgi:RNA polymerase sigma-70 factor, ECF subfamily
LLKSREEQIELALKSEQYEKAFSLLVDYQSKPILSQIEHWVNDSFEAQDLLQEVFIKAWKALPNFRGDCKISSWVFRIAYNESMNAIRSRKRKGQKTDPSELDSLSAQNEGHSSEEILEKFANAIAILPDRQKEVFLLRYYQEMSYEDMATQLQISEGALKASFHHAKKKIEEFLLKD